MSGNFYLNLDAFSWIWLNLRFIFTGGSWSRCYNLFSYRIGGCQGVHNVTETQHLTTVEVNFHQWKLISVLIIIYDSNFARKNIWIRIIFLFQFTGGSLPSRLSVLRKWLQLKFLYYNGMPVLLSSQFHTKTIYNFLYCLYEAHFLNF